MRFDETPILMQKQPFQQPLIKQLLYLIRATLVAIAHHDRALTVATISHVKQ